MADSVLENERRVASSSVAQAFVNRRISWGSILAGVVVAVVVQMMLTILGVAIGAATLDAAGRATPGVGIGAGIWFALSGIIAFFCGGWTAGRMAGIPRAVESTLHGFLAWGVSLVLGALLFTSAIGGLLGGVTNLLSQAAGTGAGGQIAATLSQAADDAQSAIQQQGGPGAVAQQGAESAGPVAGATLAGFFVLLLGGGAGALGGYMSTPKNTILSSLPAWERRSPAAR